MFWKKEKTWKIKVKKLLDLIDFIYKSFDLFTVKKMVEQLKANIFGKNVVGRLVGLSDYIMFEIYYTVKLNVKLMKHF